MTRVEHSNGKTLIHTKMLTPEIMIDAYTAPIDGNRDSSKGSFGKRTLTTKTLYNDFKTR
jgi:hypothetical protein